MYSRQKTAKFVYVYDPDEDIILRIDPRNLSDVESVKAERPIDYVRSFGDHKEFLLKVSHDPAESIIMGKGAVGVPYYVEVSRGLAGERLAEWQFDAPLRSIALSPNEESIVVGDTRGSIHVMAWKSGDVITWNEGPLAAEYVAFGPDGRTVITSPAPSSTGGKLEGTSRISVRSWQLNDLIQSACNLLPAKDKDLAMFRSLARVDAIGCSD